MQKPGYFAIATAVFTAGIGNAFIYVLGYVAMVVIQFLTKDAGGASIASALSAFIIALMFTLLLSSIITFLLAYPLAVVCRLFGLTGNRAHLIAPAVGAALACWIASALDVATSTYVAIIAFAYITAAIMWLSLGRGTKASVSQAAAQPVA